MRRTRTVTAAGAAFVLSCSAGLAGGPDAIVAQFYQGNYYGQVDGVAAYAFGYATCNLGDAPLVFQANTNDHPLWTQNLYRLKDGVFQQIGMSHVVHGFFSLQSNLCGSCSPVQFGGMGPGCSDTNSASLAGSQAQLGPRWQVNAHTADFPFPFNSATPIPPTVGRRLQAPVGDIDPALNAGATYWLEIQTLSPGDAAAGNAMNNASSRMVMFGPTLEPQLFGDTNREVSALQAWAAMDDEVSVQQVDTNDDGSFFVASRAYDNGDGTWLYVYAIHNLNNDRSARAFQMDLGSGGVTDPNFSNPSYHSGDGIDGVTVPNEAWTFSFVDKKARWETQTFDENPNANALRWATTYSFWFTSDRQPLASVADITLFKPTANDPDASDTYNASIIKPRSCLSDVDNGGSVNFGDLNQVLAAYGQVGAGLIADTNGDGVVDFTDLNTVLTEFGRSDCY